MATDGPTPPPCDQKIFAHGKTICALEASSNAAEIWVQAVARKSGSLVDWHYSGGVANVLHLGDSDSRNRADAAIDELEPILKGKIIRRFKDGDEGLYRKGVSTVPEGTTAVAYEGGTGSTYI